MSIKIHLKEKLKCKHKIAIDLFAHRSVKRPATAKVRLVAVAEEKLYRLPEQCNLLRLTYPNISINSCRLHSEGSIKEYQYILEINTQCRLHRRWLNVDGNYSHWKAVAISSSVVTGRLPAQHKDLRRVQKQFLWAKDYSRFRLCILEFEKYLL